MRQTPHPLDAIVIPVGNGALINGVAAWMKAKSPATRVIGVCAASAPSMERSWRAGRIEATAASQTIADGIAVRVPVPQAVEEMRRTVDEVLLVSEDEIRRAMRAILLHAGLLTEPSGAVGVAAIASHQAMFAGMSVATILCGANVTEQQFAEWFAD